MNKENTLFALVGLGFGLFLGFAFVVWANQRAATPRVDAAAVEGTDGADGESSITGAEGPQLYSQIEAALKAAREQPDDFNAQMQAASLSYEASRFDGALEFLLRANQLQPDNVETVVALGNANYDAGRYEAAEKWYTAALTKRPNDVNVRTDLGLTFLLRAPSDPARAIAEFRRSLERDPNHVPTLQNLVVALTRKGDKAEARATLSKLEKLNPENPALPQLRAGLDAEASADTTKSGS
ncbi:hypothetical protein BH18ACI2_BH18ACI2_15670 [soil metagenome]